MAEPVPLPPGEAFPVTNKNPSREPLNAPSITLSQPVSPWEAIVQAWLSSLPMDHLPPAAEIDSFIDSNSVSLPDDLRSLSRPQLHRWILSIPEASRSVHQVLEVIGVIHQNML